MKRALDAFLKFKMQTIVGAIMQIKIISNIHSLEDIRREGLAIDLYKYPKSKNSIKTILSIFIKSFKYDYILLNFTTFDVFFLAFLKLIALFNQCRLVTSDLILTVPEKSIKGKISQIVKTILLKKIDFCIVYFKNNQGYRKFYHILPEKLKYVPYKINSYELVTKAKITDEGYIFTGGKSRRDFTTLIKAVRELPYPIKIVTPDNRELFLHGSRLNESNLPPNVKVVHDDGSAESFIKHIAASRLVVLPIKKENISSSGIGVYIMAMALKKCVIISAGPAIDDLLTADTAIIVPPEDPETLKAAIEQAYNNDQLRNRIAENGYNYAISLGGEKRLRESVLDKLYDDFLNWK